MVVLKQPAFVGTDVLLKIFGKAAKNQTDKNLLEEITHGVGAKVAETLCQEISLDPQVAVFNLKAANAEDMPETAHVLDGEFVVQLVQVTVVYAHKVDEAVLVIV